jgi:dTDP-glucose 4,6-dehydratase
MRVLITGADGFIGSNVLEYFLEYTDWDFVLLCSWRHQGNPLNVKPNKRVEVITHDLVGPVPNIGDFDFIFHLASESHVDRSIKDPINFVENNISSTLQMLEYARKYPPKLFLMFSTDEVYGAMDHEEWDVLLPSNPYAASKAAQEMIAIAYWKTYGIPVVITNSNNIVGKNQHPEKFVPKVVDLIARGETVQIHTANGRPGRRYWNPVQNVADALLFIAARKPASYPDTDRPDKYNLSGGKELDNLQMAQLISGILGVPLKYELIDAETIRPGYDEFYAHTRGMLDERGWEAPYNLEEGLKWILSQ